VSLKFGQDVIGVAHIEGGGALRLLMQEGFVDDGYVDILDAGLTVHCATDTIRSIRESQSAMIRAVTAHDPATISEPALIATGTSADFRCTAGAITWDSEGGINIDEASAGALNLGIGSLVRVLAI
jgi:arginine N-succinyltransferase